MIKVKDGYGKLIGTTYQGSADHLLRSNGDTWAVHTGRNNEANKIVRTDSNGQLQVGWINTTSGNLGTANITRIYCSNDDYIRYKTPENFFSTLSNNGDNISITIASQNRTLVVGYSKVAGQLRSKGTISPQTGRTQSLGDVYSYHLNGSVSGGPTKYASVIGFGRGTSGTVEIAGEWTSGRGLWVRALRDTTDNWYAWDKVLTQATYTGITDSRYYTKTQADERFVNITGDTMTGELINSSANAYRLKQSNYGVILRNDNNSFWILLTNSGSPSGSYNSLRPFRINLPDGRVTIGNGLSVTGTIVGSSTIQGIQLISTIADGTAPLKVTSKTVVTNLNSDLLDGYHETSFFRARGSQTIASSIPTTTELSSNNNLSGNWNVTYPGASGHLVQFNTGSGSTRYMQFYSYHSGSLYWRNSTDSTLNTKSWKTVVDSANYTGIVLKIGTATKGSATLPIYLSAGTPTACSTTLGVSITGNAATATTAQYLASNSRMDYGWNGLNYFNINGTAGTAVKANNTPTTAWWHILRFNHANSSGYYTDLAVPFNANSLYYKRVAAGALVNGKWVRILDELNYTAYVNPANFVTSLGTNGNYVTWTKNGTTNNLTVPFATTSNVLNNLGNRTAISGATVGQSGLRLYKVYYNGYPVNFGNVLNIGGGGYGELLFQWTGDSNPGHLYYRSKRDVASQAWSNWVTILDNNNYSSTLDGRYVTLATNQTVSGIKTFSTQQKFTVATGTSPFTVSSTTVVSNLNADLLDGWHLNYILKDGYVTSATSGLSSYWRKVWDITLNNQYNDVDINLLVHSAYNQQWGIISFRLRQNGTGTAKNISAYLAEVVGNIPLDRFRLYYNNSSGLCQLWCNPSGQYDVYNYRVLAKTWRTGTEAATLGTFYTGNTSTAQSLPSDSYVSMAGITIVNTAAKVANTLTFSAGKFSSKTYNGSSAITVNVPTHTSHLTNDSGFWTGTRYWANIAVSTSSSTSTSPTFSTAYTSNWFRSTGATGWYSQTYGGGWYMSDSTWIRTFGSKSVYQNTGQIRTDGYLVTNGGLTAGATSPNNWTYKLYVTGASWSSGLIRAGGGFYHNSVNSNSYVLLAGGSYKGLGDFAKGNAGSATKGVYVTGGTVTAMTYSLSSNLNSGTSGKLAYYSSATTVAAYSSSVGASNRGVYMNAGVPTVMAYYLNATVNSGTSGKLAYYSGSNTLRSYTSTVGSAAQPIYLNAGSPSASSYSFTGTYSNPVIVWCGEIYRSAPSSTYWYSTKKGGCCSISFTTNNAGSNGNLIISIPHCEPYAAFCSTVRIFDGSTAISAGDGTISGRSAGMGDYMTICGISGTTGNVYIRKFSQQNKDNDSWKNGELGTTTTSGGNKPVARFYLMIVGRYI